MPHPVLYNPVSWISWKVKERQGERNWRCCELLYRQAFLQKTHWNRQQIACTGFKNTLYAVPWSFCSRYELQHMDWRFSAPSSNTVSKSVILTEIHWNKPPRPRLTVNSYSDDRWAVCRHARRFMKWPNVWATYTKDDHPEFPYYKLLSSDILWRHVLHQVYVFHFPRNPCSFIFPPYCVYV